MTINKPTSELVIAVLQKNKDKWSYFNKISTELTRKPNSAAVRNALLRLRNKGIVEVKEKMDGFVKVNMYRLKQFENDTKV
jgi:hypothetical protein